MIGYLVNHCLQYDPLVFELLSAYISRTWPAPLPLKFANGQHVSEDRRVDSNICARAFIVVS
jgi:hypothetical protein